MKIRFKSEEVFEMFLEEQMCIYHPNFKGELKKTANLTHECLIMTCIVTRKEMLTNKLTCTIDEMLWFALSINKCKRKKNARRKQMCRNSKKIFEFLIKEGYAVRV